MSTSTETAVVTEAPVATTGDDSLITVVGLRKAYRHRGQKGTKALEVVAVGDVSFSIAPGEILGLVGESGCGKSTTGRMLVRLVEPDAGTIAYRGRDLAQMTPTELRPFRHELQMVFQDPLSSLNRRWTVERTLRETLAVRGVRERSTVESRVSELLAMVGLQPGHRNRYPHELSGGQRQRVGIARALALEPRFLVLDEPVSALDVSVQAQILNLLLRLRDELGLAYLLISHDLRVVAQVSDRIAVMYAGHLVEIGRTVEVSEHPRHPYTEALVSAIPTLSERGSRLDRRIVLTQEASGAAASTSGCPFAPRCPRADDRCREVAPQPERDESGTISACFHPSTT